MKMATLSTGTYLKRQEESVQHWEKKSEYTTVQKSCMQPEN
jgi:hypothetical protein